MSPDPKSTNDLDLAVAQYNYALQIPSTIDAFIDIENRLAGCSADLSQSIGQKSVIHTHNTLPNMAQKYHQPIWRLPDLQLDDEDRPTITANRDVYYKTRDAYRLFATDFLERVKCLNAAR